MNQPNIQLIAAINELVAGIENGEEHNVLMEIALRIKALVEASGGEA